MNTDDGSNGGRKPPVFVLTHSPPLATRYCPIQSSQAATMAFLIKPRPNEILNLICRMKVQELRTKREAEVKAINDHILIKKGMIMAAQHDLKELQRAIAEKKFQKLLDAAKASGVELHPHVVDGVTKPDHLPDNSLLFCISPSKIWVTVAKREMARIMKLQTTIRTLCAEIKTEENKIKLLRQPPRIMERATIMEDVFRELPEELAPHVEAISDAMAKKFDEWIARIDAACIV